MKHAYYDSRNSIYDTKEYNDWKAACSKADAMQMKIDVLEEVMNDYKKKLDKLTKKAEEAHKKFEKMKSEL